MVRKNQWKKFIEARLIEAKNKGLIDQFFKLNPKTVDKTELKRLGFTGSDGDGSLVDHTSENGEDIDPEEFYSDEEDESKKFKRPNAERSSYNTFYPFQNKHQIH